MPSGNSLRVSGLCLFATACAHLHPPADAVTAAQAAKAQPDLIAVAALTELDRGHPDSTKTFLSRLPPLEESTSALQILARLLECERDLDVSCQMSAALRLLTRTPQSPLAPLAAETLHKIAGESTRLDDQLIPELGKLLVLHEEEEAPDLETQHLLREALATILVARGDHAQAQKIREAGGLLQSWEVVGPVSPFRYLQFDTPLGPELNPSADHFSTPWGDERWRPLKINNGQLPIGHAIERSDTALAEGQGLSPSGDIIYLRTTVTAHGGGLALRVDTYASLRLFLDGKPILTRDAFRRLQPHVEWLSVDAADGPHTLLIKVALGDAARALQVDSLPESAAGSIPLTGDPLAQELSKDLGQPLARTLAARMLAPLDAHRAISLLQSSAAPPGTLALSSRAELWPLLGTLDDEDARGRTQADLDVWVERDGHSPEARLRRAQLLQDLSRFALAGTDLEIAAAAGPSPDLLVAKARLDLAQEAGALSGPTLAKALSLDPGNCAALDLQLSADDSQNAIAHGDEMAAAFSKCQGGQQALANRKSHTEGASALVDYWRGRLSRSPGDPDAASQLAEALFAAGDAAGAAAALDTRLRSWPEDAAALRRKAAFEDLGSKVLAPSPTWGRVLDLDPADLTLRRALALLSGKPPPLENLVPPVAETLSAPRWIGPGRPATATLLDSGAAWLQADGTVTERIRTLEMPLDETALGSLGELELPSGAALLALKTHKRDGRVLDADAQIGGEKHTVSAPSLEVGDTLEVDYLISTPPPRRAGGGVADAFYFLASDSSLRRSVYTVQSDQPVEVDTHRIAAPKTLTGDLTLERTKVAALPEEPNSPPQNEFFPWVQIGTGNTESDLARSVADQLLDKVVVDEGIAAIIADLKVLEAAAKREKSAVKPANADRAEAEALWTLLSRRLRAEGGSLSIPASMVVGQGSGNLLLPMKAGLDALGIPSRLVLASGPAQSHEPHRFARLGEYADVLLRIEPRGGTPLYLAANLRDAPFGAVPPNLCGARALVLPAGDEQGDVIHLPACEERANRPQGPNDHHTEIELTLAADGSAVGKAHETLFGFEASTLRGALAELDDSQRRQGVESALAAIFQAVELSDLRIDLGHGPGAPLSVYYGFKVPDFASPQGNGIWSTPVRGFPAQVVQRFAQLATRRLPLLIASGERPSLDLTVRLPAGAKLETDSHGLVTPTPKDVLLDTTFGSYSRHETRNGTTLNVHERLVIPPQRIAPNGYPDFAGFASAVDQAQAERVRYVLPEGRSERRAPLHFGDRFAGF